MEQPSGPKLHLTDRSNALSPTVNLREERLFDETPPALFPSNTQFAVANQQWHKNVAAQCENHLNDLDIQSLLSCLHSPTPMASEKPSSQYRSSIDHEVEIPSSWNTVVCSAPDNADVPHVIVQAPTPPIHPRSPFSFALQKYPQDLSLIHNSISSPVLLPQPEIDEETMLSTDTTLPHPSPHFNQSTDFLLLPDDPAQHDNNLLVPSESPVLPMSWSLDSGLMNLSNISFTSPAVSDTSDDSACTFNSVWSSPAQTMSPQTLLSPQDNSVRSASSSGRQSRRLPRSSSELKERRSLKRIRNRVSASRSRDKKKQWLQSLEAEIEQFRLTNNQIEERIDMLKQAMDTGRDLLHQQRVLQGIPSTPPATPTAAKTSQWKPL